MNTDPIADMLTRVRNANRAGHPTVRIPYSKMKKAVLDVMVSSKMIESVKVEKSGNFQEIVVTFNDRNYVLNLKRVSKPGQRIYVGKNNIPAVLNGLGISIISTPQGVMSGDEAKAKNVGGELICEIY